MKAKKLIKISIKNKKSTIKMYEEWLVNSRKKLIELETALEELK